MDAVGPADGLPRRAVGRTGLAVLGVCEVVSLVVLLVNLATVHDGAVAQVVGPVHGTLYLLGIAAAFASTRSRRARVLSVIPSVGALLAWRAAGSAS